MTEIAKNVSEEDCGIIIAVYRSILQYIADFAVYRSLSQFIAVYRSVSHFIAFSRGHRSKFIWSC